MAGEGNTAFPDSPLNAYGALLACYECPQFVLHILSTARNLSFACFETCEKKPLK